MMPPVIILLLLSTEVLLVVVYVVSTGATVTVVLAVTVPAPLLADSTYVVVEPGVTVYDPELPTVPIVGDILTVPALLTVHVSVVEYPGWI